MNDFRLVRNFDFCNFFLNQCALCSLLKPKCCSAFFDADFCFSV